MFTVFRSYSTCPCLCSHAHHVVYHSTTRQEVIQHLCTEPVHRTNTRYTTLQRSKDTKANNTDTSYICVCTASVGAAHPPRTHANGTLLYPRARLHIRWRLDVHRQVLRAREVARRAEGCDLDRGDKVAVDEPVTEHGQKGTEGATRSRNKSESGGGHAKGGFYQS